MEIYSWIIEHSVILGLIISFLTLLVTFFLTIAIYLLGRRHEKERERAEEKAQKLAVIEAAKVFLIDNDKEVEYLPLAVIAAKLKLKRKHCRQLVTRYLRCSELQQQEIIRQANIPDIQIAVDDVRFALKLLQADLDRYRFGRSILYDSAKYLHRAIERWSDVTIEDANPYIFEDLRMSEWHKEPEISWRLCNGNATLFSYMWDYLHSDEFNVEQDNIVPPIDVVFQQCNLGACDESIMTFWTMRIIIDACHTFKYGQYDSSFDESLIQTQEDMYYYTLAVLCSTYPQEEANCNE